MSVGYSGKSLIQKLGIKRGDCVVLLHAPDNYDRALGKLPPEVRVTRRLTAKADIIQLFARSSRDLEREFVGLVETLKQGVMIWVSWPKKSSKIETDLSDNVVREIGLKNGLVDVKVCAIDEIWSALKFVRRSKDRRTSSVGA
ncbi:MAG TPA: hypothetical protein VLY65_02445 [Nitrososphaerales archaeon]|nr:hypothetical protein [Nitrososphaerales archaeon]